MSKFSKMRGGYLRDGKGCKGGSCRWKHFLSQNDVCISLLSMDNGKILGWCYWDLLGNWENFSMPKCEWLRIRKPTLETFYPYTEKTFWNYNLSKRVLLFCVFCNRWNSNSYVPKECRQPLAIKCSCYHGNQVLWHTFYCEQLFIGSDIGYGCCVASLTHWFTILHILFSFPCRSKKRKINASSRLHVSLKILHNMC